MCLCEHSHLEGSLCDYISYLYVIFFFEEMFIQPVYSLACIFLVVWRKGETEFF